MTDVDNFLEHHGVLGMHWGVHKGTSPIGPLTVDKKDQKWAKKAAKRFPHEIYNDAANQMNNGGIARFNNKPQYRGKDLSSDSPLRRQYLNDYKMTFTKVLNDTSKRHPSPSGKFYIHFTEDKAGNPIWLVVKNG